MTRSFRPLTHSLLALITASASAQTPFSYAPLGSNYTQDLNALGTTTSAAITNGDLINVSGALQGWVFGETGTANNTIITAGTGSSATGDSYNFGLAANADRTLGGLQSGSLVPTFGFYLTNNTGSTITTVQISYTGKTWRVGAINRSDRLDFQYSTDATTLAGGTWTDVNTLDYANPGQGSTGNGSIQHSAAISGTIGSLSIASGSTLFIRWTDFNATGSDDGMGIDDFSLQATGGATNTSVQFTSASGSAGEATSSTNLVLGITNPSGAQATTANVVLTSGNAARINGFSSQVVTFPTGSSANQNLPITITNNGVNDGNVILVFTIQNVSGGQGIPGAGAQNTFTLTIVDDDQATVSFDLTTSSVAEGGNTNLAVTMNMQPLANVVVQVALTGGTANNGSDVNNYLTTQLTFSTIVTYPVTLTVPVGTLTDFAVEPTETAIFTLSLVSGSAIIGGATHTLSITNTTVASLVINEVDYDNVGTDLAEWIELKNTGATTLDLAGFVVQLSNGGSAGAIYQTYTLPSFNLSAGGYYVLGNNATTPNINQIVTPSQDMIQNGSPDAIGLRDPLTNLVDAISYEGTTAAPYSEGTGFTGSDDNTTANKVIARIPDGTDSNNNNVDWKVTCASPGAANLALTDTDGDGLSDCIDPCPFDALNDADADGFCANVDNCPTIANASQANADGDALGDACDACPNDPLNDADADGVCGNLDLCPGTPSGESVNASGCSCSQVTVSDGNPCTLDACTNGNVTHTFQDADNDGVCDANDACAGTPSGEGVNTSGCSCSQVVVDDGNPCTFDACTNGVVTHTPIDADLDGVCDNVDNCPGTPTGEPVNTSGCSCSQLIIDDANPCTLDACANGVVTHTFQDADGDGVCNANDLCSGTPSGEGVNTSGCSCSQVTVSDGNPCTLDACANGVVSHTFQDADADGVCDANDACAGTPSGEGVNASGCSCSQITVDDGNPCTLDACANGVASHTVQDADGDGVCDANDACAGTPSGEGVNTSGCSCSQITVDDGNPCTLDACANGVASHTFQDADGDGVCDTNDACVGTPSGEGVNTSGCSCSQITVDDGDPCTLDACANGVASHTYQDTDNDGVCDGQDNCPTLFGQIGSTCDDGLAFTTNDMINASCVCTGTIVTCPYNTVQLTLNTDGNAAQASWEITPQPSGTAVCSGSGYANNSTVVVDCCLPNGCYDLKVYDSFGDGMSPGGHVLRTSSGYRIIDNNNNGSGFTTTSQAPLGFCVPIGADALIAASCDVENLTATNVLRAQVNAAVTAQYGMGNQTDDGYQFWVYNPNGGYSRRIFFSHAVPGPGAPGATPAGEKSSWFKLSSMGAPNAIPQYVLLNIRVRSRVNGANAEFGPACRMKIDPTANCSLTQLTTTANPVISCGALSVPVPGGVIHADPVVGANKFQFQFTRPGYARNIATNTRSLTLGNYSTLPLLCGTAYVVKVRASFDGGLTWCPFGAACSITTEACPAFGGGSQHASMLDPDGPLFTLWPNPTRSSSLNLAVHSSWSEVSTILLTFTDVFGKEVGREELTSDAARNTMIELPGSMTAGVYFVRLTEGARTHTERLVIQ